MRSNFFSLVLLLCVGAVSAQAPPGASAEYAPALQRGEWPAYAGTYAAQRYSPLEQINRANAKQLRVAWRWKSPDHALRAAGVRADPPFSNEGTPVMANGTLYVS